ncbi:MAG: ExbD/TolR family protein [bacterium]
MAYIPSRIKKHNTAQRSGKLNLTSMMDMFTIILVFLLKTYAAQGQLIQPSESLTLPKSNIKTLLETGLDIVVSKDMILVNHKSIIDMESVRKQKGYIIKPLSDELSFHAKEAKNMEEQFGVPFSGKVTIQGDKSIEYKDLVKVMATCGASEYPNMRLVVYQKGRES